MVAPDKNIIREELKAVPDPEIGINIVDLGLIYDIACDEQAITVTMTLSTPGCPMGEVITDDIKAVIKVKYPEHTVHINLVWEPAWSPDMISQEGKVMLGYSQQ